MSLLQRRAYCRSSTSANYSLSSCLEYQSCQEILSFLLASASIFLNSRHFVVTIIYPFHLQLTQFSFLLLWLSTFGVAILHILFCAIFGKVSVFISSEESHDLYPACFPPNFQVAQFNKYLRSIFICNHSGYLVFSYGGLHRFYLYFCMFRIYFGFYGLEYILLVCNGVDILN